jgi:hypothetical protein
MELLGQKPDSERPDRQRSPVSAGQQRQLVKRILSSQQFRRSPAMRAFLCHVTENQILGRTDKLKEQCIGYEVLGRRPDYNPSDDNIVRVRAHELRTRLERYFSTEGAEEPVMVTIPKGGYAPEFTSRYDPPIEAPSPVPAVEIASSSSATATEATETPAAAGQERTSWRRAWLIPVALLLVVATAICTNLVDARRMKPTDPASAIQDFWRPVFAHGDKQLKIVYADTSFALWQDLNGQDLGLGDYLNRKYLDVKGNQLFNVVMRRVTTPSDMSLAINLTALAARFGVSAEPEFARDVDSQFFHQGNALLIGSRRSNPWVSIFEPFMNFVLSKDDQTSAPAFRNRTPHPGEALNYAIPAMYDTQKVEEKTYTSYGVVALLRGCGKQGMTIVVEGLNSQATQAAGDFITDPQRLESLLQAIGHKPGADVTPFEALFEITSLPGGYDNPKIIDARVHAGEGCSGN